MDKATFISGHAGGFFTASLQGNKPKIKVRHWGTGRIGGSATTATTGAVTVSPETHPLAPIAGLFAGEPMWDEYMQAMKEAREEGNALGE
jgi:hypothetical protein